MIETREVTIYEIPSHKVGMTTRLNRRLKEQGNPDYRIVQVIPPNTLTVRECWEHEQDWAATLGYETETENNWALVEGNKTNVRRPPIFFYGDEHSQFKGTIVNSNGERFIGKKEVIDAGYTYSLVNHVINNRRKTHKGLQWWREPDYERK
jgi:hypothetical protein